MGDLGQGYFFWLRGTSKRPKKKCVPALKKKLFIKLDEEANCIFLIKIFG